MGLINGALGDFEEARKLAVWSKGAIIPGLDPLVWRSDRYGNMIKFDERGNRNSQHGWEIDHITPASLRGSDDISNLQPLHWKANASKGALG